MWYNILESCTVKKQQRVGWIKDRINRDKKRKKMKMGRETKRDRARRAVLASETLPKRAVGWEQISGQKNKVLHLHTVQMHILIQLHSFILFSTQLPD